MAIRRLGANGIACIVLDGDLADHQSVTMMAKIGCKVGPRVGAKPVAN